MTTTPKIKVSIDGILNVIKPPGKTSFDMVSIVRRLSGQRRVGHAGTLDPDATGVLLLFLGKATKVLEFAVGDPKTYWAEIELGVTTDTYDASGKVIDKCATSFVTKWDIEQALKSFRGVVQQVPPMYSALHHEGKRLYQLARAGIEVPREPRDIHISHLDFLEWLPPVFTMEVECSSGTYIRSLAHDIGQVLGCGAHLRRLVRLKCGAFSIDQAVALSSLEEAFHSGSWPSLIHPIDEVLLDWEAVIVGHEGEKSIRHGRSLPARAIEMSGESIRSPKWCRAYSQDGQFLAVLQWQEESDCWHPTKVLASVPCVPSCPYSCSSSLC